MNNIYGIKDSANFTIKRKSDKKVFLYAPYATQSENAWTSNSVYAKSKDVKAIRFDGEKDSTLKVSMEIFDLKWLSMLSGSDFVTGVKNILAREVLTVDATKTITLTDNPITGSLQVYLLEDDGISNGTELVAGEVSNPDEYTIADNVITLGTVAGVEGTKIVAYYLKASEATAKTLTIKGSAFPFSVEIFGDTMIRDTDGNDKFVQIHYFNCKAKSNFTLTFSSSDITKLDVEFDIFKDSGSDDMAEYTII